MAQGKTKRTKKSRDDYSTKHHLTPKSRGGSNDEKNIKKNCPWGMHKTWNKLFNIDLRPEEIILVIQHLGGKESFVLARSRNKRPEFKQAWEKLFGTKSSDEEVIEKIKKEWMERKKIRTQSGPFFFNIPFFCGQN